VPRVFSRSWTRGGPSRTAVSVRLIAGAPVALVDLARAPIALGVAISPILRTAREGVCSPKASGAECRDHAEAEASRQSRAAPRANDSRPRSRFVPRSDSDYGHPFPVTGSPSRRRGSLYHEAPPPRRRRCGPQPVLRGAEDEPALLVIDVARRARRLAPAQGTSRVATTPVAAQLPNDQCSLFGGGPTARRPYFS
jgi:hypothetical protein